MAFSSGINGKLYFGSSTTATTLVGQVKNWTWAVAQTVLDTTSLSDTDRTVVPSTRSTTGSCSLHYYGSSSTASTLISKIVKTGGSLGDGTNAESTQVTFKLEVDGSTITIPAYITNASMSCSVGEVVSVDISFEADGAAVQNSL